MEGKALPEGWLGKNHACHQLSKKAVGNYLLFLDADVQTGTLLVDQSLAFLVKNKLSLLSIFPVQKMGSFGEKITIPIMNWILVSLLPMLLISRSRNTAFAAANGQFMLFDGHIYRENEFHKRLRHDPVEDIEICKLMKSQGYKVHTLLGNDQISCRMYKGFRESIYGFSKNVVTFFGNSYLNAILFSLITTFGWLAFPIAGAYPEFLFYVLILLLTRIFVSVASKQHPLHNIFFMPLQQLSFVLMVIQSIKNRLSGIYIWKGRQL
jgi:chlorobactene glucosyltransferase